MFSSIAVVRIVCKVDQEKGSDKEKNQSWKQFEGNLVPKSSPLHAEQA